MLKDVNGSARNQLPAETQAVTVCQYGKSSWDTALMVFVLYSF